MFASVVLVHGGPHRERGVRGVQSSPYSMAPGNVESGVQKEFPPLIREAARDCVARYDLAFHIKAAGNGDVAWSKVDAAL